MSGELRITMKNEMHFFSAQERARRVPYRRRPFRDARPHEEIVSLTCHNISTSQCFSGRTARDRTRRGAVSLTRLFHSKTDCFSVGDRNVDGEGAEGVS